MWAAADAFPPERLEYPTDNTFERKGAAEEMNTQTEATAPRAPVGLASRLPLVALLLVQIFIGYEWFMSGLTKIYRGGFPSGLAKELTEKSRGAPGWYKSFLDGSIIPNATPFGYVIEIGELLIGVALIAAAIM